MIVKLTYRSPLPSEERSRNCRRTARLIALIAFPSMLVATAAFPRLIAKIECWRIQRVLEAREFELEQVRSRAHLSVLTFSDPVGESSSTSSSKPAAN